MLRVIISGYSGSMGKVLTKCANEDSELEIVCGASKDDLDVPFKTYHKMSEVEELADVIVYSQNLLDKLGLDADEIVNMKMSQNEAKYPVEKAKGKSDKYTEL